MPYLQNGLILLRGVELQVPLLSSLELPEGPLQLALTGPALTGCVPLVKVVFAIGDGDLLPGINVPESFDGDHIALLLDELAIGLTVMVDEGYGPHHNFTGVRP